MHIYTETASPFSAVYYQPFFFLNYTLYKSFFSLWSWMNCDHQVDERSQKVWFIKQTGWKLLMRTHKCVYSPGWLWHWKLAVSTYWRGLIPKKTSKKLLEVVAFRFSGVINLNLTHDSTGRSPLSLAIYSFSLSFWLLRDSPSSGLREREH